MRNCSHENDWGARNGFVTIVLDLDTLALVSVLKGRGQVALLPFFSRLNQPRPRSQPSPPTCPADTSPLSKSISGRPRWYSIPDPLPSGKRFIWDTAGFLSGNPRDLAG